MENEAGLEYLLIFVYAVNNSVWLGAKGGRTRQEKEHNFAHHLLSSSPEDYSPALEQAVFVFYGLKDEYRNGDIGC